MKVDLDKRFGRLRQLYDKENPAQPFTNWRFQFWFEEKYGVRLYLNGLLRFEAEFDDTAPELSMLLMECGK